jgi:ribosomal-protein-serine acetyltransferase
MSAAITIRPYRLEDAGDLHAAARESVAEMFPWLSWCHPEYSMQDALEWTQSREDLARLGLEYSFVITGDLSGERERFLGGCGINQINRIHQFGNLGYWVRSAAAGRGVAVEAVRLLAEFAFAHTELVRLEILCAIGNDRSRRVAEKAGAVLEGVLRDRLTVHGSPRDAALYSLVRSRVPPFNS